MWGIHNDQSAIDPVADDSVRIGWDELGDLSQIAATREAFKAAVGEHMPDLDEAKIPSNAGTLHRFVHEMREGDVVVCPNRKTSTLDIVTVGRAPSGIARPGTRTQPGRTRGAGPPDPTPLCRRPAALLPG